MFYYNYHTSLNLVIFRTVDIAKFGYCHKQCAAYLSPVTRVYCDKTTKASITQLEWKVDQLSTLFHWFCALQLTTEF